ncbi:hypothetical protein DSM3645_03183 [Blastopirellula marina DSM 3645]|uniref:Uncharacterized protein n=1 Tax=Blastopirellula marina DSM 3645 TaxID=314230 RepID=A3ZVV0_9BACT|nr:hypothetical protein DSM3645_03183 [Blastopirellula marina DSM 3645]
MPGSKGLLSTESRIPQELHLCRKPSFIGSCGPLNP